MQQASRRGFEVPTGLITPEESGRGGWSMQSSSRTRQSSCARGAHPWDRFHGLVHGGKSHEDWRLLHGSIQNHIHLIKGSMGRGQTRHLIVDPRGKRSGGVTNLRASQMAEMPSNRRQ